MKLLEVVRDRILIAFLEVKMAIIRKELEVVNINIKARYGSLRHVRYNVARKIILQDRGKAIQRKLEKLKGNQPHAEQEPATQKR